MKRLPLLFGGVLGLVLLGLILWKALGAVQNEERVRLSVVAERVFDELERSLQAQLEEEEERPFLHWNNRFAVGNDDDVQVLQRSPLASRTHEDALVGYFQRAPGGVLSNPYRNAEGQPEIPEDQLTSLEEELKRALAAVPEPIDLPVVAPGQSGPPILQQLNKGYQQKSREGVVQMANSMQLGNFKNRGNWSEDLRDNRIQDVPVEPFSVDRAQGWLVFRRSVQIEGSPWEQGLVVRREPWLAAVQDAALGELPGAELTWDSEASGSRIFSHRFQDPYTSLTASLALAPLPGSSTMTVLWGLTGLLVLVVFFSGGLVWRWLDESARLAQQRTDFVAAVTHELRTPLTSIRMYAEMLELGMAPPTARADYLATIRTEAERLGTLVEGVLTFAKLERGGRTESSMDSLESVVHDVVRVLSPIAREQEVELTVDLGTSGATEVPAEALKQVLHNLLDNAIKFAEHPKQVQVHASSGDVLELRVHNTGPPLAPRMLRRMFQPFVRGETELTRSTKGTGIGLAVVRGLTSELNGTVRARNTRTGVEIRVRIPPQTS